jgi:hypothetical protein
MKENGDQQPKVLVNCTGAVDGKLIRIEKQAQSFFLF